MGNMKKRGESLYNNANERFKESISWNKVETVDYMTTQNWNLLDGPFAALIGDER